MERHVVHRRCSGEAWFRRPVTTALIPPRYIKMIEGTAAEALLVPSVPGEHDRDGRPRSYRPYAVHSGGRVRSPIEGVPPRVWWLAVKHRLDEGVPADEVVNLAMNAESFSALVPDGFLDQFVACLICGEVVVHVASHQRTNTRCRTAAAASRVLVLWADGYRDPWTASDHPPLTWAELQVARWRRRLTVIEFLIDVAVLIARSGRL